MTVMPVFIPLKLNFGRQTIHPQSKFNLGADIHIKCPQSPPFHFQDDSKCKVISLMHFLIGSLKVIEPKVS